MGQLLGSNQTQVKYVVKFTPKSIETNVNISHTSPIKEVSTLLAGLIIIFGIIYIVLGIAMNALIRHIPDKFEATISHFYTMEKWNADSQFESEQKKLQVILDELIGHLPANNRE